MTPAPVSVQLAKTIPVNQSTPRKFELPAPDRNAEAAAHAEALELRRAVGVYLAAAGAAGVRVGL